MSRCFPFPPPGYEKKPRPEDEDLLKEEKRKEKKHKKEKKDREKKEGKEKRDKDRSDGKHREKKDKKDKHRDKKEKHKDKKDKEKDKDKDKERSDISEEARVAVLPGVSSGQKLPSRDEHFKKESINSQEAKYRDQSHSPHAEKLFKTSLPTVETEESKFVQELARRIRNEQKGAGSQLAERFPVESKRDEKTNSMYIKDFGNFVEEKEKKQEKRVYCNKMDGHQVRVEPRIGVNATLPSFPEMAKSKFHGLPPLEENVENRRDEKDKSKEQRDDKPRDKKKDKEKDAKSHGKEKDREKEKKKEKKAKDKSAHRKSEPDKSRDINKSDFVSVSNTNHQVPLVPKDNRAGTVTEGNLRKRKDIETNGFLHESEVRPAKLLRPSSSHQPTQNGKISDTDQKAEMLSSNKQGVAADVQVVNKERSINGTIKLSNKHGVVTDIGFANKENGVNGTVKGQPLAMSKPKASSMSPGVDQIAEASKRPPHPDSKYLNQILSVPKMDEWSGIDDQEWLFGSKSTLVRKPDMCLDEVNDNRVWSEALQIDSADVCALPYVIPY
ncbi:uncharacterized protein LOC107770135 [Nicotiana tabacum]|uniref:uncharacterized protein LOC107770135 n=1 Tax=Nicotiana tabacum TaxID=4097 RepID=UPI003F4E4ACA